MNRANATAAIRGRIEDHMHSFNWRHEAAASLRCLGDERGARSNLRIAELELQKVAELLSIENHLNGVSPE